MLFDSDLERKWYNGLMDILGHIRVKIGEDMFEFSKHALDQSVVRKISLEELRQAVADATLIEDYPDDKYGPSCLLFGLTQKGRPLHILCSHPSRNLIKIITLYEPDGAQWIRNQLRVNPPKSN
jgi:hypothetical protein